MNKKTMIAGMAVLSTLFVSGCTPVEHAIQRTDNYAQSKLSSVAVPFEWFKLDKSTQVAERSEWKKVQAFELPVEDKSGDVRRSYEKMLADISVELKNEKAMASFANSEATSREGFPYFDRLATTKDVFGEAVRKVYGTPYQYVQSLTLTGIGERIRDGKVEKTLTVTMNSVNDTDSFYTHDFLFSLDGGGRITDVTLNQERNRVHTVKPLTKDSEWETAVHKEFSFAWEDFRSFPKTDAWNKVSQEVITSWVSSVGLDDKTTSSTFYDWYRDTEGELNRGKITGYLHTDDSALAHTLYEVTYPHKNTDKTTSFTVVYDRGLNTILGLQKGSPFNYKGE